MLTTAILLYLLGILLMKCEKRAFLASLAFLINPSAPHFTAIYTETLFTFMLVLTCYLFSLLKERFNVNLDTNSLKSKFTYLFSIPSILAACITSLIRVIINLYL